MAAAAKMSKSAKKLSETEVANAAALEKIADAAKAFAEFPGSMRFNNAFHFWQIVDPEMDDGSLRVMRYVYMQVPVEKEREFLIKHGAARKLEGGSRERLAAFCKDNEMPEPMGGTGECLQRGHVEYLVPVYKNLEVSASLLNKHGKCNLSGLKENAIVCVGIERATVRKEVGMVGGKGFLGTQMKDVTVEYRRIVAIVPPEMYAACEIPAWMDKVNDREDDMAFFD